MRNCSSANNRPRPGQPAARRVIVALGALVAAAWVAVPAWPRVELGPHIQDQMVVQRGRPWQVSGTASDGELVRGSFLGQRREVRASGGAWSLSFDVPPGYAGPAELVVGATVTQVAVGEVWLCSGQSNMALPVSRAADGDRIAQATAGRAIHLFQVRKPLATAQPDAGRWMPAARPEALRRFSAICLAFGAGLHELIQAPVGLIDASLGATAIESWIGPDALRSIPLAESTRQRYAHVRKQRETGGRLRNATGMDEPSQLFELMVRPLASQPIQGVLWYQGEGNRRNAEQYAELLSLLIRDWRASWSNPRMPFVVVQLPGHGAPSAALEEHSAWAAVRDAQRRTVSATRHSALVVTIDLGDGTIHPPVKEPFGRRSAEAAFDLAYRPRPGMTAPAPTAIYRQGNAIKVEFGEGRSCLRATEHLAGSTWVAGDDRRWQRADVAVERSSIVARSALVDRPAALRYAWSDYPRAGLVSCENGLPVTPFRTDEWPR